MISEREGHFLLGRLYTIESQILLTLVDIHVEYEVDHKKLNGSVGL